MVAYMRVSQPPAFAKETKESIKKHIEEKYLIPKLEPDQFSAEKPENQWDFDWFSRVKMPLQPSLPRSVVVPTWELPFRRQKEDTGNRAWEPKSVEVNQFFSFKPWIILNKLVHLVSDILRVWNL